MAANDPVGIVPFHQFLASLQQVSPPLHVAAAGTQVEHADAANEMHSHLVAHYQGIEAVHSFVDDNGSVFDCVPVEKQPALRNKGAPPKAPDAPAASEPPHAQAATPGGERPTYHVGQLHPDRKDRHGNVMHAPAGTIPLRRLTMENLTRFKTLHHFFQKSPYGSAKPPQTSQSGGAPPGGAAGAVPATHRWAHAFQNVSNVGGHSFINVWDPPIGANQIFSLSQHWYVGGSAAGLQTAEVGWQVYPQMYGNTKPVFFIYWTADNYQSKGCYNLSCTAFVQTNGSWAIGGAIAPPWSVAGGQQREVEVSFYLTQGRWWLYVGGGAAANAIGYYPVSIYNNGAMASHASEIDYGGETVGTTSFPPMGGGVFANQGYQHAAYHRDVRFFPSGGGNNVASLTAAAASPACYTAAVTKFNAPWNETLFYGGPGGTTC
ncbi:MAG: hypothetical protein QOF14_4852 [Hyphomicrobiales bacterium]|jgi:hypothetical protein|nr:hypothetical protein [Hyphomicrobiales bacterium]